MELAVSTMLDRASFPGLTSWDDLGDAWTWRLSGELPARPLAEGVPHSQRNPWPPECDHCH